MQPAGKWPQFINCSVIINDRNSNPFRQVKYFVNYVAAERSMLQILKLFNLDTGHMGHKRNNVADLERTIIDELKLHLTQVCEASRNTYISRMGFALIKRLSNERTLILGPFELRASNLAANWLSSSFINKDKSPIAEQSFRGEILQICDKQLNVSV